MTRIEPNSLFTVWRPDEVAECLDGVATNSQVYRKLWEMVRHYDKKPRSEVPDDFSERALSNWWHELSPEDQKFLNQKAEEMYAPFH